MDREHRRELKHDRFVDEVGSLTSRARENQRLLLIVTVSLLATIVVAYGIFFYRSNHEQKAQAALSTAIDTIESPLIPDPAANPGAQPNPNAKFHTAQERDTRSEALFRDVQKNFSGTAAADVANIYLARLAATKNDSATARKLLLAFISEQPKHMLVGGARYSLYQLRINGGEAAQVTAEINQELAKTADQVLPADALLALLGQAYEAQGNSQQSRDAYRRIVTQFPESAYAQEAQRHVGTT